ncbi:hypothetical protein COT75_04600 [Candidatus Beckwithbacteria bacterium CG10_big_fil_rev_8_21_14_0_10_34_10]|uniref:Uncharacterized protein n=1 Tax=Candidatus Beckwithbacteria bacterium CG10_big_fil_rev_8_21_14_0_10_34_10 TaxID=1974495 RepID=A0A2H0W876_9BACT|nr:MAG: hypothetical protein COT75_04600 [Candidatus Beckwithbacteria bacterium CG10_big_fil_rev_8_21_14_0_10_34_10]
MKLIKKIIAFLIFLFGSVAVVHAFNPEIDKKLKDFVYKNILKKERVEEVVVDEGLKKVTLGVDDVLGTSTGEDLESFQEKAVEEVKNIPQKIMSQEVVKEFTTKVNQIVVEQVEANKDLPKEQIEKAKSEVRSQIYQEICGEWLKNDE